MSDPEFGLMFSLREEARLRELHRWLTREVSTVVLGGLVIFLPVGLIFLVMIWAAIPFSFYMLWRLFQCGRYGWILGFVLTVLAPFLFGRVVSMGIVSSYLLTFLPLIAFYAYTWMLRLSVSNWLEDLTWKKRFDAECD